MFAKVKRHNLVGICECLAMQVNMSIAEFEDPCWQLLEASKIGLAHRALGWIMSQ